MAARLEAENEQTADDGSVVEIEPENANAVQLFLRMQSQWKVQWLIAGKKAHAVRTGLDYAALPVVAGALGFALDAVTLDGLRIMEARALALYQQRSRSGS